MKNNRFLGCASVLLLASSLGLAQAATTTTGQINATITLISGCEVNGQTAADNLNLGTLDFGTHSTVFGTSDAEVVGDTAGAITVQCSPDLGSVTLKVKGGLHDGLASGSTRALGNGSAYVPYDLYWEAARATPIPIDGSGTLSITADGTPQTIHLYGRAKGATGLTAGTYTDTIQIELTF
jgi:spore coat protein U-like protein